MTYEEQMEQALKEMTSHPEFLRKMNGSMDFDQQEHKKYADGHRLTGWWRKRMYRKKLIRRFLGQSPSLKIADMPGSRERCGVYVSFFRDNQYDPRKRYNINLHEMLRISPAGDIRVCKKKVVHSPRHRVYGISSSDIPFAKEFTNRRIRSKAIRDDDYIPSGPSYYKKEHSRMICNQI